MLKSSREPAYSGLAMFMVFQRKITLRYLQNCVGTWNITDLFCVLVLRFCVYLYFQFSCISKFSVC